MSAAAEGSLAGPLLPVESAGVVDAGAAVQTLETGAGVAAPSEPPAATADAPSAESVVIPAPSPVDVDTRESAAPEIVATDAVEPLISEPSPGAPPPKPAPAPALRSSNVPDYGNEEGVDISPPLPSEWSSPATLPAVALYGEVLSPPSCKVRALLAFYGVPFTVPGKRRPGSPYVKRPHITIGSGSELRQINDSLIIFRTLGMCRSTAGVRGRASSVFETSLHACSRNSQRHAAVACRDRT